MAGVQNEAYKQSGNNNENASGTSSVPLLGDSITEPSQPSSLPTGSNANGAPESSESAIKAGKRKFWSLGKKKEDEQVKNTSGPIVGSTAPPHIAPIAPIATMRPVSPLHSSDGNRVSSSPQRAFHPYGSPSSPGRNVRSSSPRSHSPASSQIFERSVQEDVVPSQASPSIPSHIITENHIPPVLEASSVAITNDQLDPDSVEIVTSSIHQPASVTVTGAGLNEQSMSSSWHEDFNLHPDNEDTASNYGTLDSNDVRRLSFISFADVVHAEHAETAEHPTSRDSMHLTGLSTNPSAMAAPNRSPSPVRSPVSSHGLGTSPPTSISASFKGLETSPNRAGRGPGSPMPPHSPPLGGELNIETMRQALRKTGSGDLSGARSQPMSAVGNDDGTYDRPFKRE